MENHDVCSFSPASIVAGAILLVFGIGMLLDHTEVLPSGIGRLFAPFVLIALGTMVVLERGAFVAGRVDGRPRRRGDPWSGLWLIGIGIWMMISEMHLFGLTYRTSWPLFIILSGIMIVGRGLTAPGAGRRDGHHD